MDLRLRKTILCGAFPNCPLAKNSCPFAHGSGDYRPSKLPAADVECFDGERKVELSGVAQEVLHGFSEKAYFYANVSTFTKLIELPLLKSHFHVVKEKAIPYLAQTAQSVKKRGLPSSPAPATAAAPVPATRAQLATPKPAEIAFAPACTVGGSTVFVVQSLPECGSAFAKIRQYEWIAMDCEGENLSRDGALALIQIGTPTNDVYLFDVITLGSEDNRAAFIELLRSVLESKDIGKLLHDCRRDGEAIFYQLGVKIVNPRDTQVMYAMLANAQQWWRRRAADGREDDDMRRIGLNRLLQIAGLPLNEKKDIIAAKMRADNRFWSRRPLTSEMIEYASGDVVHLFALYGWLRTETANLLEDSAERLSSLHAEWFIGRSGDSITQPLDVTLMLKISHETNIAMYSSADDRQPQQLVGKEPGVPEWVKCANAEFQTLLDVLPDRMRSALGRFSLEDQLQITEVLLHAYRSPVVRFDSKRKEHDIKEMISSEQDVQQAVQRILQGRDIQIVFSQDNRAGLPGCLHRISALRDRSNSFYALTYRVGRYVPGSSELIRDLVATVGEKHSLLLLGPPGVGKTTLLRDVTKMLADELSKRVVVVDTSNEIAGDHPKPHSCIGRAVRMQVADRSRQHEKLIEAVQNQSPEIIVVDEIGTDEEVKAARTIANRGVGMIGTAHGISLRSLMKNPSLRALIGGIQTVTLGDAEARKQKNRNMSDSREDGNKSSTLKKTQMERAAAPTFDIVVELLERRRYRVFRNVAQTIDDLLLGNDPVIEERWMDESNNLFAKFQHLRVAERERGGGQQSDAPAIETRNWFEELVQSVA